MLARSSRAFRITTFDRHLSPKLLRGETNAFNESREFRPDNRGLDVRGHCEGGESAIRTSNYVLPSYTLGKTNDAVSNDLRMLNNDACVCYHTGARRLHRTEGAPRTKLTCHNVAAASGAQATRHWLRPKPLTFQLNH
jgi:hypothetical protein